MLVKTEGIIIRSVDYGEGNKILTIFSSEAGKLGIMARGAKKTKSRFTAVSQLFTHGIYLFQKGTGKGLGSLSQGEIIHSFKELRQDIGKTAYAAYFAELVDKLLEDGEISPALYQLFLTIYTYLDQGKDPEILARLFEIKMLMFGGYKPELNQCVRCTAQEGRFSFSSQEGGFLCHTCLHLDPNALHIQPSTVKLLRLFYHFNMQPLGNISVKPETKAELRQVLWSFIDHHTPLRLKSRSFLEKMEKFME